MRKVVIAVVIVGVLFLSSDRRPLLAYTITPADTVVSAYINNPPITPSISPTPTATPSATPTPGGPTPSVSPTPTPSVSPTPTPIFGERFSLFGYTSPGATVSVSNPGMYRDTVADNNGYFSFTDFFLKTYVEDICITAQDQAGRVTMPVCIPPSPSNENQSVGPVLMPPTISLNRDSFYSGDSVIISGQTTPQTNIQLSLFTDESKSGLAFINNKSLSVPVRTTLAIKYVQGLFDPVKPSYAATRPKIKATVDKKGNFTLALPSNDPEYFRTFAQTIYNSDFSLKSITLNFNVFPGWFAFIKWAISFFSGLKSRWFELVIFSQIVLIAYLILHRYLQPHVIARMRSLAVIEHPLPLLTEHQLALQEHELNLQELMEEKQALNHILGQG